jgi:hypothetical protein
MTAYAGPPPDIADFKGHGPRGILITSTNCSRISAMAWEKLALPDNTPFTDIDRLKRFACSTCGSKAITIMPDRAAYKPQGGGG